MKEALKKAGVFDALSAMVAALGTFLAARYPGFEPIIGGVVAILVGWLSNWGSRRAGKPSVAP